MRTQGLRPMWISIMVLMSVMMSVVFCAWVLVRKRKVFRTFVKSGSNNDMQSQLHSAALEDIRGVQNYSLNDILSRDELFKRVIVCAFDNTRGQADAIVVNPVSGGLYEWCIEYGGVLLSPDSPGEAKPSLEQFQGLSVQQIAQMSPSLSSLSTRTLSKSMLSISTATPMSVAQARDRRKLSASNSAVSSLMMQLPWPWVNAGTGIPLTTVLVPYGCQLTSMGGPPSSLETSVQFGVALQSSLASAKFFTSPTGVCFSGWVYHSTSPAQVIEIPLFCLPGFCGALDDTTDPTNAGSTSSTIMRTRTFVTFQYPNVLLHQELVAIVPSPSPSSSVSGASDMTSPSSSLSLNVLFSPQSNAQQETVVCSRYLRFTPHTERVNTPDSSALREPDTPIQTDNDSWKWSHITLHLPPYQSQPLTVGAALVQPYAITRQTTATDWSHWDESLLTCHMYVNGVWCEADGSRWNNDCDSTQTDVMQRWNSSSLSDAHHLDISTLMLGYTPMQWIRPRSQNDSTSVPSIPGVMIDDTTPSEQPSPFATMPSTNPNFLSTSLAKVSVTKPSRLVDTQDLPISLDSPLYNANRCRLSVQDLFNMM